MGLLWRGLARSRTNSFVARGGVSQGQTADRSPVPLTGRVAGGRYVNGMPEPSLNDVTSILANARTIAVLGASTHTHRAGYYVPAYLAEQGYRILPVNPNHVGETLFGEIVRASLAELKTPIDIVDVFRRPDTLPDHLDELLAMSPRPAVVWFQLGITHDGVANELRAAGIRVVQDRCTLADHRRLF